MGKEKLKYTKEFLEKVKNGDTTATTLLYEDAKDIAYKKAYSILNNHHDAEDIAEDSVLRAIEKIDTIKRPGDFPAWIKRIAENKAKDYIKKKKPTYIGEDFEYTTNDLNSDQSVVPEKMVDSQENIDLYKKLISKLTDDQRNALVLNRIEGYKIREIAEMLDCSESTIKSRIHQGEKKLVKEAEKLKKKGYTLNGMMPLDFFTVMSKSLGVTSTNVASVVGATVLKSLSLKIVASIVAVVVVVSGVMGVSYIYGEQETTNSTTTKVVETTTQPPKPDYNEAYKAYKTVLKQNAFEIKDYDFQNETNKSKQIVFADILGDDTPELIFTKATIDSRDESRKNASLNIYSYANGKCEKISFEDDYSSDLKDEYILQTDDIQMYTPYIIYQKKNDKSLYMFQQKSQQL